MPRLPGLQVIGGPRSTTLRLFIPPAQVVRLRIAVTTDQLRVIGLLAISTGLVVGYQLLTRWSAWSDRDSR